MDKLVGHIEESLSKPVCKLDAILDCRSEIARIAEVSFISTFTIV